MPEIISFYSVAPSQGKRTLSLGFAELLADQQHKTLYVELDYINPSVAVSTQISNSTQNVVQYFQNVQLKQYFNIEPYVLTKEILIQSSDQKKKRIFSSLSGKLDYLVVPSNHNINSFPDLIGNKENDIEAEAYDFIQKFIYALKNTKYQYIVLNLPNQLESLFSFEVMANSDKIANVITPSANRIVEFQSVNAFLNKNIENINEKMFTLLNMTNPDISHSDYQELIAFQGNINYDPDRQFEEFQLKLASENIKQQLEPIADQMGIPVTVTTKRRGLFGRG